MLSSISLQIFDLDRLIEYRKTELRDSTKDQVSFIVFGYYVRLYLERLCASYLLIY